jgi:chromate reductase, NAD(P)H dehydrogenase (quinone)
VETRLYEGMAALPAFNPDLDGDAPPQEVADLRNEIRRADALVFSTPEYAGALPGSFKNLLDWTVGDARQGSIYRKPVAWLNVSARGAAAAHDSLRSVLGYVGAEIVEPACIEVPVTGAMVGDDGLITDAAVGSQFAESLTRLTGACGP